MAIPAGWSFVPSDKNKKSLTFFIYCVFDQRYQFLQVSGTGPWAWRCLGYIATAVVPLFWDRPKRRAEVVTNEGRSFSHEFNSCDNLKRKVSEKVRLKDGSLSVRSSIKGLGVFPKENRYSRKWICLLASGQLSCKHNCMPQQVALTFSLWSVSLRFWWCFDSIC